MKLQFLLLLDGNTILICTPERCIEVVSFVYLISSKMLSYFHNLVNSTSRCSMVILTTHCCL
ncbi:hypothetical protein Leryth_002516 [Lithospermum erythrorhizon]|nr:hypothetical protein Leryth_002516 [Lithospermum erythrorhizon]